MASLGMVTRTRPFPGFEHLYRVSDSGSTSAFVGRIELPVDQCFAAFIGDLAIRPPVRVRWAMGRCIPQDFIWTTSGLAVVVSEACTQVLRAQDATGWDTYDVELMGRDGERISGYKGLVVRGRCGPLQDHRRIPVIKKYPGGMFPAYRGDFFDEDTWDGSDVFVASGTAVMFVTEKVQKALRRERMTGVQLDRSDLVERPE